VNVIDLPESLFTAAVSLWHETGLTRPWNDPNLDLRRAVEGSSSAVLAVVGDEGTLLGTAMVGHDGHRGWVYYLAVRADHQRTGLGRCLMDACESWVRQRDIPKIQLMVRDTNHHALSFYAALGYEPSPVTVLTRWVTADT
jgi:ribosomal protein S18 acetylase RimI-like enzyme